MNKTASIFSLTFLLLLTGCSLPGGSKTNNGGDKNATFEAYKNDDEFLEKEAELKKNFKLTVTKTNGKLEVNNPKDSVFEGMEDYDRPDGDLYSYKETTKDTKPFLSIERDSNHFVLDAGTLKYPTGEYISNACERYFSPGLRPNYVNYNYTDNGWEAEENPEFLNLNFAHEADNEIVVALTDFKEIIMSDYFYKVYRRATSKSWKTPRFNSFDVYDYFREVMNKDGVCKNPVDYGHSLQTNAYYTRLFDYENGNTLVRITNVFVDNVEFKINKDLSIAYAKYTLLTFNPDNFSAYGYHVEYTNLGTESVNMTMRKKDYANNRVTADEKYVKTANDAILSPVFTMDYAYSDSECLAKRVHIEATLTSILFDEETVHNNGNHTHELKYHVKENGKMMDYEASMLTDGTKYPWEGSESRDSASAEEQVALYVSAAYRYVSESWNWEKAAFGKFDAYNQFYLTIDSNPQYVRPSYARVENNILMECFVESYSHYTVNMYNVNKTTQLDKAAYLANLTNHIE